MTAEHSNRRKGLAVIAVGDTPRGRTERDAERTFCGNRNIYSEEYVLLKSTEEDTLVELIGMLNQREDIDGILVQLPLPEHVDSERVLHEIAVSKYAVGQELWMACSLLPF